ncbi:MAG: HAD family phosphatase [Verrucomicrobiae bacterium]|nr:HAD family phosphatase [Verrucomicrobiae bacterium]NNJ41986.1 HAD family phosphatase [Akkermansiaceae bacterium]
MDFLFDIGNVIVGVDFIPALSRLAPSGTQDIDSRLDQIIDRKDEFEAGLIAPDVYFPWAANLLNFAGSHEEFLTTWVDIFTPNTPMWKSIEKLHAAGHRLILFSNINNPHKDYLIKKYPVFQYFTGGIFSYQTGHIKPEPAIYQLATQQYHLTPETTAYIDDLPANINAGKEAGFICHEYRTDRHRDFLDWVEPLL